MRRSLRYSGGYGCAFDPGHPPFYDFPAEHWRHLRTTNPIESTFATIRLRHRRTKGSGSRTASLTMMFKLAESASKRWRLLNGSQLLPDVLQGTTFKDGIQVNQAAALNQPLSTTVDLIPIFATVGTSQTQH